MYYFKPTLIAIILLTASQANAMWKLAQQLQKAHELSQQKEPWDEKLLEAQDLDGFLLEAVKRKLNPNASISSSKETALTLACKRDKTGEQVKKLLSYGGIKIMSWESDEGIWSPLYYAVQENHWRVVDFIIECESLPLSLADINFATKRILEY